MCFDRRSQSLFPAHGCVSHGAADRPLVMLGSGGHARELADVVVDHGCHRLVGHVGPYVVRDAERFAVPWLGTDDTAVLDGLAALIGIGSGRLRASVDERLTGRLADVPVVWHRTASLARGTTLGPGTALWPGAVLTADVHTGRHVHVTTRASVSHDTVLADYVTLLPGCTVAGRSSIGRGSTIGAGATVIDGIRIGAGVTVGAGAVVIRDVPDNTVVVGVPARPLRRSPAVVRDPHRAPSTRTKESTWDG